MTSAQLDLFDLIEETKREQPAQTLFSAAITGPRAREAAFEAWAAEHGRLGCNRRSHAWHQAHGGWVTAPDHPGCEATVLYADLRCDHHERCWCVGNLLYRGSCECGWESVPAIDENRAVEDILDHLWPGWSTMPLLPASMPQERTAEAKWTAAAIAVYPVGWLEAGGPCRTARGLFGTRHVSGRTPWRGYDVGVLTGPDGHELSPVEAAQLWVDDVERRAAEHPAHDFSGELTRARRRLAWEVAERLVLEATS